MSYKQKRVFWLPYLVAILNNASTKQDLKRVLLLYERGHIGLHLCQISCFYTEVKKFFTCLPDCYYHHEKVQIWGLNASNKTIKFHKFSLSVWGFPLSYILEGNYMNQKFPSRVHLVLNRQFYKFPLSRATSWWVITK